MKGIDFSSWQNLLSTLFALALVTLIGVGVRLLAMSTIQQRRERSNRQINERLKLLIAAYKVLGGSFTGDLRVDPRHLRVQRSAPKDGVGSFENEAGSDRSRRIRDAVEAALADIILLGTEHHVRLAERAVRELTEGKNVHTHELVTSLREFIREALDLDPIPKDLIIPMQGPSRMVSAAGKGTSMEGRGKAEGGGGGGGLAMGAGGLGLGTGLHKQTHVDDETEHEDLP